ncbi:hypothetical protein P691DRAFT_704278 [Macrolepiota fuliginosa MF-IS2]|uniref:F-box domain-containing protein n=1 Tax=Macrolepiota fuliginosa MF-IS2 TaxID=1400762 RepID=A0A9P6C546_9AGAR|nr:hypothetical protein P691DRAFT_704278 [Macrolepiota fuliginosa MF-IS2]
MSVLVQDLETILSSNIPPTRDEAASLRELLSQQEFALSILYKDITRLQARLKILVDRHRQGHTKLQQYQAALSSARVLPPELVRKIFIQCAADLPIDKPPSHRTPPLSLTQICSGWRDVALTTPELWSRFMFRVDCPEDVTGFKELVHLWFRRSHTRPLSLVLSTTCQPGAIPNPLLDTLQSYTENIASLDLDIPTPYLSALAEYPQDSFTCLHSIRFRGTRLDGVEEGGLSLWTPTSSPFQFAPNLTDVFISIPRTRVILEGLNLPWSQLSSLRLAETIVTSDAMLRVLGLCTNLTTCSARLVTNEVITASEITLSSLTFLSLYAEVGELAAFLRYISVPAIKNLSLHLVPNMTWDPEALIDLVSRSQCQLDQLSFSCYTIDPDMFITLLYAIQGLRTLDMMFVSFMTDDVLERMTPATVHEDPPLPLLKELRWREVSLKCSPRCVRRFISARGWPLEPSVGYVRGNCRQGLQVAQLEGLAIRSTIGHFGPEWSENLDDFKGRGLNLSYGVR